MKLIFITLVALVCLVLLPGEAGAVPTKLYQIEVIAFEHVTPDTADQEKWPVVSPELNLTNTIELQPYDRHAPAPYQILPKKNFTLAPEQWAFRRNPNYRVLLHQAWSQPMADGMTKTIQLHGSERLQAGSDDDPQGLWQLNGTLRIRLNRYFTVHPDLKLCEPAQQNAAPYNDNTSQFSPMGIQCFSLDQTRRMRSRETNYFDHPLFGLLVRITPVT